MLPAEEVVARSGGGQVVRVVEHEAGTRVVGQDLYGGDSVWRADTGIAQLRHPQRVEARSGHRDISPVTFARTHRVFGSLPTPHAGSKWGQLDGAGGALVRLIVK